MSITINETIIAGSPDDFLEARHLVLRGTNREIGNALGTIGRDRHDSKPERAKDPLLAKLIRRYYHEHYPIHEQRLLGVSDAFGIDEDDTDGLALAVTHLFPLPGCSISFIPPHRSQNGSGLVSRDYDFGLGTRGDLLGIPPLEDELPVMSRPYLIEMHPDEGYSSLSVSSFDLLGVLDGINSEGLMVGMLADNETLEAQLSRPTLSHAVGIEILQAVRMLLDTCANVDEAKEALLMNKHYYIALPAHFIVADRHGNSFVWEHGSIHNSEYIIDGGGEVQTVTNDLLHRVAQQGEFTDQDPGWSRVRRCRLAEAIEQAGEKLNVDALIKAHASVDITPTFIAEMRGVESKSVNVSDGARTLWHGVYDINERSVTISFYLGDNPDGTVRRSPHQKFTLAAD